jgi:hypothetical protein
VSLTEPIAGDGAHVAYAAPRSITAATRLTTLQWRRASSAAIAWPKPPPDVIGLRTAKRAKLSECAYQGMRKLVSGASHGHRYPASQRQKQNPNYDRREPSICEHPAF